MKRVIEKTTKTALMLFAICFAGGAWADFAKTNPVTGATENYTYKFVGETTWNGTDHWQDSSGANPSGVPGKQYESTFDPFFFDGNTININAGMAVDGWTLRMGLYNGAYVSMNNLQKFQDGTMWVTVDETSKVRIHNVNDKYEGDALNLYSARESGIEWTCALSGAQGTGLPFNYYLKGNGSVAFTTITAANCSHTIKQADVTLHGTTATGRGKRINSKTLVTFTSSTQTFLADATIKVKYANGESCKDVSLSSVTATTPTLTTADDIGDCELVQTSTGIVLYYVDYVYTPSISINFTDSSANLTTENDVGLAGYTAPGAAWNNIAAAVGTTSSTIKMIDATGTATVNSGISVQIATTRGSWCCSSLSAATDPRQGYIDEDSGDNTTPTITVSGIPFSNYRVIVYHATDNGDVKFGYDTINGTNLTYVDGALTTGTTAWGDTGDPDTSHPMEEGVNTLVSGVLSGSTATIVAHRGSGFRGCVAAVQIVEASNASLEETGGYAADCSQIVFKNTTLAELTGDTLSARFGGEWAGAVKTSKLTFNNFDRSAEASGTITCEAQVQHDNAVKGLLLTFTQVGDDVAVKTTGAKYKTGTVGESIASATDATGHYAIYNFALPRTPETSATIVWESGEFEMTKVGSDGNAYSFSSFGGLSVNGDGNLVVDTANAQGAIVNLPDTSKTAVSVLIKYSNLATETGGNATLANCAINSGNTTYYLGARTSTKGTFPLTAYYAGNAYAFNDATYGSGNVPSMDTGSGYFLFAHGSSNGTYAYSGETIGALDGGYNTRLKWGGYNITKVSIGGGFENSRAYCWKGSGTVIEKVAIFLGSIKTPSDLADYYFPSAVAKDYEKWEYAKAMLTRSGSGELAAGTYKLFDAHSGLNTDTNYNGNTSNYSLFGYTGSGVRFWKYLCYASLDDPVGWQAPGLALRFSASETSANKTIGGTFGPVQFAGLYVESGAIGYSFTQTGSKRDTILGDPSGGSAETWFVFDEPFAVQRNGTMWFAGTVNLTLTESTDVLTLNTSASDGSNDCAPHIVESITKQGNGVQVTTSATTAGGTLKMHGAGYLTATKLTATGATLDFSDIGSRYNAATPFINCPLTIDGDTKFVFPEDIVLPYTYKVATSITVSSGTPTTEYTDANGNVYTVPLTVDTANGTVTISDDLTGATAIEVNGALTISAATAADITVNAGGTLTVSANLTGSLLVNGTVNVNNGVSIPAINRNSTGIVVAMGNITINGIDGGVIPGTLDIMGTVTVVDTTTEEVLLTQSNVNVMSGGLNLSGCTALTTVSVDIATSRTFTLGSVVAYPASYTLNLVMDENLTDGQTVSIDIGSAGPTSMTIEMYKPDTTLNTTAEVSLEGTTASVTYTPTVSGKACWVDYEMEFESGNASKTGWENSGTDTAILHSDSDITGADAFNEDTGMLYTYAHPYKNDMVGDKAFPDTWTAVVRCTVPNYADAAVITFGWNTGFIGLIAGETPDSEMRVVQSTGGNHYVTNAVMTVQNATKAQHVYIFTVETNQSVTVYCDESLITNVVYAAPFTIATSGSQGGFQIGSILGGKAGGVVRFAKDESPANTLDETVQKDARIDCVRLYKGVLGENAIHQLSQEFPAVKLFEATISGGNDNQWATLGWTGGDITTLNSSSKIILTVTDDATLTLPSEIVAEEFVINITAGKTLTLNKAAGGTTFTTTEPIEVNAGSIYLANETSLGDWQISGTGTVRLPDGLEITGALTGAAKITVVSGDVVTVTSTGSIANTVVGEGRIVFEGALPSGSALLTSLQDSSSWTGTVELKNYTQTTEIDAHKIINFGNYGNSSSTVALNGVTSTMYTGNNTYPDVTLGAIEIGEGGWSDNDGLSYTVSPLYTANLTGHGTITVKTGNEGTVRFVGDHTFDGSVAFGDSTGKQVAFMKTADDTLPSVTAKTIVVAGRTNMSIASGKTWTADAIKIDGSLTVLTTQAAAATSSVEPTAYLDGATITTNVNGEAGTTTYVSDEVTQISDNQASLGAVTVSEPMRMTGSGGALMSSLTINDGATLTYDPVITPLRVESAPVFNGTGKLKLAARYAGVTCGKFHLVTYPSESFNEYSEEALKALVDSSSFNNASYTVTEETVGSYKQLVLTVGDYDSDAKDISIAQFGDSITEGIWRSGYRGTPNYRIPLMQLLEAYGYRPEARGYRSVGSTDANGVPADDNYKWHTGISAQRIHTGLTGSSLRAGFMESIEAHLEQVGVTDIITLKIGTNDSIGNETADNMFEGWSNLVWKVVNMRPTSKIVVCAPVKIRSGENNAPGLRTKIADYMALTYEQGGFPNGQVTMINGFNIVTDDANHYLTDNVHPNWNGHLQLANAWLPAVTNAFESMTARATVNYPDQTVASAESVAALEDYRAGYVKLATFTNFTAKAGAWGGSPYVSVNEAFKDTPMSRVAYFVARKTTASPDTRYVWVDMDADETTGTTLAAFGMPTNAAVNGVVNNLHIYSNSSAIENVAPNVSGVKGTLMRTEKGVSKADGISTDLAPDGPYGFDWNDSINGSGSWGVMNMARIFDGATPTDHRKLLAAQMLFDFNGFNGERQNALGLGNFAVHGPYNTANGSVDHFNLNWTFTTAKDDMPTMDANALETGIIEIWGFVAMPNEGGADAGYIDGTTAVITNTTSSVTVPAGATAVAVAFSTGDELTLTSASLDLATSGVTVYATDENGQKTSTAITAAFKVTAGDNNTYTVELDDTKTVNGVKVKPEVDTEAETAPMAFTGTAPVFTVKTIPGLWYVVASGSDLESLTNGTPAQADEASETLTAPTFDGTVQYYKVRVGPSKDSVQ